MAEAFFNFLSERRPWVLVPLTWLLDTVSPSVGSNQQGRDFSPKSVFGVNTPNRSRIGFMFRINPQRADFTKAKARSFDLTKAGYQNTYWFEREQTIALSGTTGAFGPIPGGGAILGLTSFRNFDFQSWMGDFTGGVSEAPFDITVSEAWQNFEALQRIFEAGTQEYYSLFTDDLSQYIGAVNDFGFTQDANDPFQIKWNLTFISVARRRITLSTERITTTRDAFKFLVTATRQLAGVGEEKSAALYLTHNLWKAGLNEVTDYKSAVSGETQAFVDSVQTAIEEAFSTKAEGGE